MPYLDLLVHTLTEYEKNFSKIIARLEKTVNALADTMESIQAKTNKDEEEHRNYIAYIRVKPHHGSSELDKIIRALKD